MLACPKGSARGTLGGIQFWEPASPMAINFRFARGVGFRRFEAQFKRSQRISVRHRRHVDCQVFIQFKKQKINTSCFLLFLGCMRMNHQTCIEDVHVWLEFCTKSDGSYY
jgi:hypothetical protein